MSNINCHRREIIYSVRTPIIALQSWIIGRIHTSMPVFDDIERNELGPRPHAQPDSIYLNAIGSPRSSSNSRRLCGAEKFEAMVKLGVANNRMKDFYDLQVPSSRLAFDGKTLSEAVEKHS
jgi:hypothetical protein